MNKHFFRNRLKHLEAAVAAAKDGKTILVLGTGFYYQVFENLVTSFCNHQVLDSNLEILFESGGVIRFVNLTPGGETGKKFLDNGPVADLVYLIEDHRGSMAPIMQHIVLPVIERSGPHCGLCMLGEPDEPELGDR